MNIDKGTSILKEDTVLNADSVEWCPYPDHQQILLCGTYKLLEAPATNHVTDQDSLSSGIADLKLDDSDSDSGAPQIRVGGVIIYKFVFSGTKPYLQTCDKTTMCGVLDIKWPDSILQDRLVYGVVDAEGQFQLFQLQEENYASECLAKGQLSESSLGLSLSWTGHSDGMPLVAASDSTGFISVFQIGDDVHRISSWQAHDYEAWITAFHKFNNNVIYSGGDDSTLKGWDLRSPLQPTFCSRKHQMGVCSIQSHPFNEHIFASGSYDEELIIWDERKLKQPLSSCSLGGGVWRIKWDPFSGSKILTATMYNGTHIVDCSDLGQKSLPVVAQYNDHNLAYGADWCRLGPKGTLKQCGKVDDKPTTSCVQSGEQEEYLVSTCSFYDHSVHIWQWSSKVK